MFTDGCGGCGRLWGLWGLWGLRGLWALRAEGCQLPGLRLRKGYQLSAVGHGTWAMGVKKRAILGGAGLMETHGPWRMAQGREQTAVSPFSLGAESLKPKKPRCNVKSAQSLPALPIPPPTHPIR